MRRLIAAVCVCSMMAVVGVSPAVGAGNNSNQTGLVNVSLGDVALLNNVNLAVAANLAATVCGVTVPVAVLAQQVVAGSGAFTCDTTSGPLSVTQALNGAPGVGGILNNVNLGVAANVAATLCGISVPVAALAVQVLGPTGGFTCDTATGPLTVTQS
jgi:hypothetical protein